MQSETQSSAIREDTWVKAVGLADAVDMVDDPIAIGKAVATVVGMGFDGPDIPQPFAQVQRLGDGVQDDDVSVVAAIGGVAGGGAGGRFYPIFGDEDVGHFHHAGQDHEQDGHDEGDFYQALAPA
ncbi:MAG: hypothetical protein M5U34_14435 [Chloroflexi bacterium]|nr:hypothetical protein [Chloroflexota bacterium]